MGFSANSLGRLNIQIGYTVDKTGLSQIQQSLNTLIAESARPGQQMAAGFQQAAKAATQLGGILSASTNHLTGELDMTKFAVNMRNAGMTMQGFQSQMVKAGGAGAAAFSELNQHLLNTRTTATKVEGVVGQLGKTFMNTFMYSFSYRIVGKVIQGISNAITYVKDLDKALTDISIVTKENTYQMEQFAEKANSAAKALAVSTKDYAQASLIFAQQGLKGQERDIKTETTLKVANVTGEDAAEVSQNLTALWNGYKVASNEVVESVDKIANVAAHSASNLSELTTAMTKVASAANTVGVSEDQLISQLATMESVTRQAPETIGVALKTIYARMGDLKVEGADEDGIGLGEVSGKLHEMGVEILDQEGNMKEMGVVMEDLADKWDGWTRSQKQAAAVAVAGKRQYTQLMALLENWDMYKQNLNYSKNAKGEVDAQQEIYKESVAGIQAQAKAAWESASSSMFETGPIKEVYKIVAGIGDLLGNMGSLLPISAFALLGKILQSQIVNGINSFTMGLTKAQKEAALTNSQMQILETAEKNILVLDGDRVRTLAEVAGLNKNISEQSFAQASVDRLIEQTNVQKLNTLTKITSAYMTQKTVGKETGQDQLKSSVYQTTLAQAKRETLDITKQLSAEDQEQLLLSQQKYAAAESDAALHMAKIGTIANELGLSQGLIENIGQRENGELKIIQFIEERIGAAEQEVELQRADVDLVTQALETLGLINATEEERIAFEDEIFEEITAQAGGQENLNGNKERYLALAKEVAETEGNLTEKQLERLNLMRQETNEAGKSVGKRNVAQAGYGMQKGQAQIMAANTVTLTNFTNAAFNGAMAVSSLYSAIKSLKDTNMSGVEKLTSVIMGFTMAIMMGKTAGAALLSIFKGITASVKLNTGVMAANVAMHKLDIGLEKKAAVQKALSAMMQAKKNGEDTMGIRLAGFKAAKLETENSQEARGIMVKLMSLFTEKSQNKFRLTEAIPTIQAKIANNQALALSELGIVAAIALVVIALGVLVVWLIKGAASHESAADKAKKAQDAYRNESEALKDLTDNYEELKSSLDDLRDKYTHLDTLTKGTKEWKEEVLSLNSAVLELTSKYPELLKYVEKDVDGVMKVSQEGYDLLLDNAQQAIVVQQQQTTAVQSGMFQEKANAVADQYDVHEGPIIAPSDIENGNWQAGVLTTILNGITHGQYGTSAEFLKMATEFSDIDSEDIQKAVGNEALQTFDDFQKEYKDEYSNEDIQKIYQSVENIRILNDQQLEAAKESAAAAREANKIKFRGEGNTQKEKEANIQAKNNAYDAIYAKTLQQANKSWEYDGDDLAFNFASGDDTDAKITGKSVSKLNSKKEIKEDLAKLMGVTSLSKAQKEIIDSWKDTSDIDAKAQLAKLWKVDRSSITYDEESHTFKDQAGHERSFDSQKAISTFVDNSIKRELAAAKVDKDLLAKLSTDQAQLIANVGKKDVSSFDVSDLSKSVKSHLNDQEVYDTLHSAGINDKDIEKYKQNTEKKWQDAYDSLTATAQKLIDNNKKMTLGQAQEADDFIQQEKIVNRHRKGKKNDSSIIDDLYKNTKNNVDDVTKMLQEVNWSENLSLDDLRTQLIDLGIKMDDINLDDSGWKQLIKTMSDAQTAVVNLDTSMDDLVSSMDAYIKYVKGLKPGDDLSKEEYQAGYDAAVDKDKYASMFYYNRDNDKYIVKQTSNTDEDFKDAMMGDNRKDTLKQMRRKNKQWAETQTKEGKYLSEYEWDEKDKAKNRDTAKNIVENMTKGQLELLKSDPRYTDIAEAIKRGDDLNSKQIEILDLLAKSLQNWGSTAAAGGYDNTKGEYLSSVLQSNYTTAAEALNYANQEGVRNETEQGEEYTKGLEESVSSLGQTTSEVLGGNQQAMAAYGEEVINTNKSLKDQSQAVQEAAIATQYNMTMLVESLSTLWNDTYKDAKKGTADYAMLLKESANYINKYFGANVNSEWIKNNKKDVQAMANGSVAAFKKIQKKLAKQAIIDLEFKFKTKKLQTDFDKITNILSNSKVEIGAGLKKDTVQNIINPILAALKMTEDQADAWAARMGYSFKWKYDKNGKVIGVAAQKNKSGKNQYGIKIADPNQANLPAASKKGAGDDKSGSNDASNYTYEQIDKNDLDKLHDLKQAMEDLTHALSRLKTEQEGLFGDSLIKNLEKQNKLIKEQTKNLQKQVKVQTKELGQSQTDMTELFGFKFNKKGRISNYKKILNARYNAYKEYLTKYNKLSAKQQDAKKGKLLKGKADKAKTKWSEAKNSVSEYDSLFNERQENMNKMLENFNTIAQNNIKKLTAMSEALKSVNEVKQTTLDIDKEMFHASNDYGYLSQYNLKSAKLAKQELAQQTKELNKTNKAIEKLKKKGFSKTYSTQMKSLVDTQSTLIKNIETSMKKIKDSVLANIEAQSQAWKEYADNMGKVIDQLQSIVKLTQTYSDVSKLIFGEDAYDKFKAYDEQQLIANLAILNAKNKELEASEKRETSARQALEAAQAANDAATIEKTQKELDEAIVEHNKLKEEVASSGKDAVDNAISIYTYGVKQTLKELTKSLSSGYGWDVISNTMKFEKSYSDEWLDNAQRIGNITQLTAEFDQEIAKAANSSASAQQKILQCKQEQLANLEKIDKLTQYDIERARLKMSLTLKQIALEEARENKSRLRLKRDSQGNYSYQYGADLEAIKKAEEEEAAARLKVNEEDQKEFQRLVNQRLDLMKQYTDEEEKYREKIRTAENEEEKQRFEQEWKDRQTYITNMLRHNENSLNTVQKTYLENDSALGYYNDIQGTKYTSTKQMTEKDYNQYREFLYGEEGLLPSYDSGFSAIEMSTDEFLKQNKKASKQNDKILNDLQDNLEAIGNVADDSFKAVIKGSDNASGIVGATNAAKQASTAVQNLTTKYVNLNTVLKNSAISAINLYNTMTGSAAKNAINSAANAANNAENFKANTKAAMKYITNNASNVITATKNMSDEAKILADNWNGVYEAAKKAAKKIKSSGGGGGSDFTPTTNPTYTPTNSDKKTTGSGSDLKNESTVLPPGYTVKKGKGENKNKWYVYHNGQQVMKQEHNSKKSAIKAANRLANASSQKTTKKDGKINLIDVGSYITLKSGHGKKKINSYKKTKNGFSKIKGGKVKLSDITSLRKPRLTKDMTSKYVKVNTLYSSGVGPPFSYNYWFSIESIRKHFKGFDTGGYTGTWDNKGGRLALLHQKEIVLNKQDTANFLQAVKLTRMFAKDLGKYKTGLVDKITAISNNNKMINTNNSTRNQALKQNININATFPNVSSSTEIEKAFQQLSAKATQYAWSNKIK